MSRIFLGVVLVVAVVLIVIVACSRPSSTEPDQNLSLAEGNNEASGEKSPLHELPTQQSPRPSVASTESPASIPQQPAAEPEREPKREREMKSAVESPSQASPEGDAIASEKTPVPSQESAGGMGAQAGQEQSAASAAGTEVAAPRKTESEPAAPSSQGESVTGVPEKKPAVKPSRQAGTAETENDAEKQETEPAALQRLSREFARRRAAKEEERGDATAITLVPPVVYPPTVSMSQEHRRTCLVFVGDEMPDGSPVDADGKGHSIRQSLGKQYTVVVFWDSTNPYALDEFEELSQELAPFADQGVTAIAIHVGPAPENYRQLCEKSGQGILCLLDPDRTYFAKVAQTRLPRTYLLDAQGKIVWLDIEYSRTTRYDLRNALQFCLQKTE